MTEQAPGGRIGTTMRDSEPWFPPQPRPAGAPNVIVVLLDDTGFAQLSSFGSDIETPNMDRLATDGLRYNRFHVTAICSPTRASLLTGRNHHAVGMGHLPDIPLGFPGYRGRIPASAAPLPRVLRDAGFNTMAVGKWHLTPRNDRTASGPFDHWPLGWGFERFYGFLHGDANHWTPTLVRDNAYVEPPARPEDGYHLSEDLFDTALAMIADQHHATPGKPFFCYLATGAAHAPHHVPPEWIERYRGRFDDGWEASRDRAVARQLEMGIIPRGTPIPPRPSWVDAWDGLPAEHRRLFARFQEVFAGFVSHLDHQLGRLLDGLERMGLADDTVVVLASDNGASAEGGRLGSINEHRFGFGLPDDIADSLAAIDELGGFRAYNHYPWGWAWAGNAPLRLWKRYTWLGGSRTPLVMRVPGRIPDPGAVRHQFTHVVDLFPTILELCGVDAPETVDGVAQQRLDGTSLVPTLGGPDVEVRTTQYFEMMGSRSIYHDGWKATTDHVPAGVVDEEALLEGSRDLDDPNWALFDLRRDFAEAVDVSAEHPQVLADLESRWQAEAEANQVFPLIDALQGRVAAMEPPTWPIPRTVELWPGFGPVADEAVPSLATGSPLTVEVEVPEGGGEGVLCAMGDWNNGWALVVLDGHLTFLLNVASRGFRIDSAEALPSGAHTLGFRFVHRGESGGPEGILLLDGETWSQGPLPQGLGTGGIQIGGGGLRLAHDSGFPVSDDYRPPFPWTGTMARVVFGNVGPTVDQLEAENAEIARRE